MRAAMLGLGLLLVGCLGANQDLFYPAAANSRLGRHPAVTYALPAAAPLGDVQITSLGETEIRPGSAAKEEEVAVRLVVENDSDVRPWSVDLRRVALTFVGDHATGPVEAEIEGQGSQSPIVWVARGQQRTIDLYFVVPPAEVERTTLPDFDVTWQVQTGTGLIARRTTFLPRSTSLRAQEEPWAAGTLEPENDHDPWFGLWRD